MDQIIADVNKRKPCSFTMMSLALTEEKRKKLFALHRELRDTAIRYSEESSVADIVVFMSSTTFTVADEFPAI